MLKLNYFSHAGFLLRRLSLRVFVSCFAALFLVQTTVYAHNNVVVIPMAGDDVPAELTPTITIANVETDQNDYTISAVTVIDKTTKLEWQRMDDNVTRNWDDAWRYCANLNLDGHNDWRLPSVTELQSIVDYGSANAPDIDPVAFTNTDATFYWTATNSASISSSAWLVSFQTGSTGEGGKFINAGVRCVR